MFEIIIAVIGAILVFIIGIVFILRSNSKLDPKINNILNFLLIIIAGVGIYYVRNELIEFTIQNEALIGQNKLIEQSYRESYMPFGKIELPKGLIGPKEFDTVTLIKNEPDSLKPDTTRNFVLRNKKFLNKGNGIL